MVEVILSATLLTKVSLLIIIIILFDYYDKFLYSMNLCILGFISILLFFSLSVSADNYLTFILLIFPLSFCLSLLSYYLSFPNQTLKNITISLLILLVAFKLIPIFLPEFNLGIDTRELIKGETVFENKILLLSFLIATLSFVFLYYYDSNSPLKIGLQLLSIDKNSSKYIPINKTYLIFLFSIRITIGIFLISLITIHKGLITIDEFGFDFLFEVIAFLLLIMSLKNYFKIKYNNIFSFILLFVVTPVFFVYVFEMIQRIEVIRELSQNIIYAFIWILILSLTIMSTLKKKKLQNV